MNWNHQVQLLLKFQKIYNSKSHLNHYFFKYIKNIKIGLARSIVMALGKRFALPLMKKAGINCNLSLIP